MKRRPKALLKGRLEGTRSPIIVPEWTRLRNSAKTCEIWGALCCTRADEECERLLELGKYLDHIRIVMCEYFREYRKYPGVLCCASARARGAEMPKTGPLRTAREGLSARVVPVAESVSLSPRVVPIAGRIGAAGNPRDCQRRSAIRCRFSSIKSLTIWTHVWTCAHQCVHACRCGISPEHEHHVQGC